MKFERSAGILLHPISLPGNFGIGEYFYSNHSAVFIDCGAAKIYLLKKDVSKCKTKKAVFVRRLLKN